jgi:hypothetical protein
MNNLTEMRKWRSTYGGKEHGAMFSNRCHTRIYMIGGDLNVRLILTRHYFSRTSWMYSGIFEKIVNQYVRSSKLMYEDEEMFLPNIQWEEIENVMDVFIGSNLSTLIEQAV